MKTGMTTAAWTRLSSACLLAAGLTACAGGFASLAPTLTWTHFLAGDDLRRACDDGAPDRYRLIFHDRAEARLRLFEIIEDQAAGGAVARARTLTATDMAQVRAGDDYADGWGEFATLRFTPLAFAQLAHRLERLGAFETPQFGETRPAANFRWLIGGCRAGAWFYNGFTEPAAAGELIGFGPF